jgi:hypothetical protein
VSYKRKIPGSFIFSSGIVGSIYDNLDPKKLKEFNFRTEGKMVSLLLGPSATVTTSEVFASGYESFVRGSLQNDVIASSHLAAVSTQSQVRFFPDSYGNDSFYLAISNGEDGFVDSSIALGGKLVNRLRQIKSFIEKFSVLLSQDDFVSVMTKEFKGEYKFIRHNDVVSHFKSTGETYCTIAMSKNASGYLYVGVTSDFLYDMVSSVMFNVDSTDGLSGSYSNRVTFSASPIIAFPQYKSFFEAVFPSIAGAGNLVPMSVIDRYFPELFILRGKLMASLSLSYDDVLIGTGGEDYCSGAFISIPTISECYSKASILGETLFKINESNIQLESDQTTELELADHSVVEVPSINVICEATYSYLYLAPLVGKMTDASEELLDFIAENPSSQLAYSRNSDCFKGPSDKLSLTQLYGDAIAAEFDLLGQGLVSGPNGLSFREARNKSSSFLESKYSCAYFLKRKNELNGISLDDSLINRTNITLTFTSAYYSLSWTDFIGTYNSISSLSDDGAGSIAFEMSFIDLNTVKFVGITQDEFVSSVLGGYSSVGSDFSMSAYTLDPKDLFADGLVMSGRNGIDGFNRSTFMAYSLSSKESVAMVESFLATISIL